MLIEKKIELVVEKKETERLLVEAVPCSIRIEIKDSPELTGDYFTDQAGIESGYLDSFGVVSVDFKYDVETNKVVGSFADVDNDDYNEFPGAHEHGSQSWGYNPPMKIDRDAGPQIDLRTHVRVPVLPAPWTPSEVVGDAYRQLASDEATATATASADAKKGELISTLLLVCDGMSPEAKESFCQAVSGLYSDPDGYGFHPESSGFINVVNEYGVDATDLQKIGGLMNGWELPTF